MALHARLPVVEQLLVLPLVLERVRAVVDGGLALRVERARIEAGVLAVRARRRDGRIQLHQDAHAEPPRLLQVPHDDDEEERGERRVRITGRTAQPCWSGNASP